MMNADDTLIAPRVFSHYRQMGVMPGWSAERFIKLCHLANRTPEEVGAFAALMPAETRYWMRRGHFTPPVSLHFAAIESTLRSANYGDPIEPVVPLDFLHIGRPQGPVR
jgi:hypothetical protein